MAALAEQIKATVDKVHEAASAIAQKTDAYFWQYEQAPGVWHSLDMQASASLEKQYQNMSRLGNPQAGPITLSFRNQKRVFDLTCMEQRNEQTGRVRKIRRSDEHVFEPKLQSESMMREQICLLQRATQELPSLLKTLASNMDAIQIELSSMIEERDRAKKCAVDLELQVERLNEKMKRLKQVGRLKKSFVSTWTCPYCDEPNNASRSCCNNCRRARAIPNEALKDDRVENASALINKFREAVEMWRDPMMREILGPMHAVEDPTLCKKMERILRGTSHAGPDSECDPMSKATVTKVLSVLNPQLWETYCQMKSRIKQFSPVEAVKKTEATKNMQALCSDQLYWAELDETINEVWAFHGTKSKLAENIAATGIDPKRCVNGYYGKGFYAAQQACKSLQYTDAGKFSPSRSTHGCMVLCRVLLGKPEYAVKPDSSKLQPEESCFSVVVNPGKEGGPLEQQHQEFVLFDQRLVYPEFIIFFEVEPKTNASQASAPSTSAPPTFAPQQNPFAAFFGFGADDYDDDYDDHVDDDWPDDGYSGYSADDYHDDHLDDHHDDHLDYFQDYDDF